MSTVDKEFEPGDEKGKTAVAKKIGVMLAIRAKAAGINKVIFDRGGSVYHGRVKSLSEGAREGGLEF
jgi:large subunit ribosomal protein L18